MSVNVLFIDDEETQTRSLIRGLRRVGFESQIETATCPEEALEKALLYKPEVVVVDLSLTSKGPISGLELISEIISIDSTIRIIVLTGHSSNEYGIKALKRGAASFLGKPVETQHLQHLIEDGIRYSSLKRESEKQKRNFRNLLKLDSANKKMQKIIEEASLAASSSQAVLILGETGSGKGVVAKEIHDASKRSRKPFVRFQPSFGNSDLIMSELFGYEKGAFTGASCLKKGLIEEAAGGTLFLDEVDELPKEIQIQLLDVLQEKKFRRIGSSREIGSDFRLIAATNADIKALVGSKLREDFYHRIAHMTLQIPPLRDRKEDIISLSNLFLYAVVSKEKIPISGFTSEAEALLLNHTWSGNIRELQAVIEGSVFRAQFYERSVVDSMDLGLMRKEVNKQIFTKKSFRKEVQNFEKKLIFSALDKCDGNQSKAAELLAMDRSSLRRISAREE